VTEMLIRRFVPHGIGCRIMATQEVSVAAPLWPLVDMRIEDLFGDRSFGLELDPMATVLTGENGSGKSTLLKATDLLAKERWAEFSRLPFRTLILRFNDGTEMSAENVEGGVRIDSQGDTWTFDRDTAAQFDPHTLNQLRRRANLRIRHGVVQSQQILLRGHDLDPEDEFANIVPPKWLTDLVSRFTTKYISARRLEHRLKPDSRTPSEETPTPVVEQYAEDLGSRMRDHLSAYAAESRKHERNLPAQIVQAMQSEPESAHALAQDVENLQGEVRDLADSLARVGLLYEDPEQQLAQYPQGKTEILLAVREVYRVARQRLEQLTVLRTDLEFFVSFLNSRLSGKRIELNKEHGISVLLENGEMISPRQLSSGEQQLLALAYELLFGTAPNSVVLLDEPELSLHVTWLKGLLSAFLEMAEKRRLQFIIATHAPSVFLGHNELEQSLDLAE
jgi:ABC-type lipoprotein export system ATPase subunit